MLNLAKMIVRLNKMILTTSFMNQEEEKKLTREAVKAMACSRAFCDVMGINFDKLDEHRKNIILLMMQRCADDLFPMNDEIKRRIEKYASQFDGKITPLT